MLTKLFTLCISLLVSCCFPIVVLGSPNIPEGIKSGDLVFRDGGEAISSLIKSVDSSGFSHVGMLEITPQGVYVIHATPKERIDGYDGVNRDTLEFFIQHAKDQQVSFFRVDSDDDHHQQALYNALSLIGKRFSIDPKKGVYCTELVTDAWAATGVRIINGKTRLSLPLLDRPLILPKNIIHAVAVLPIHP